LTRSFAAAFAAAGLAFAAIGCGGEPPMVDGMCKVKPGSFRMGFGGQGAKPDEKPVRDVELKNWYYVDEHEVTNRQYAAFLKESKRNPPASWASGAYPAGQDDYPVNGVTFEDAVAYAKARGKRLPTAEEWEYAARGPDSRIYPWGNDWKPGMCNSFEAGNGGPVKVEQYKDGRSWCGTYDQAGNLWEWTASGVPGGGNVMIIKGGSFAPAEDLPRSSLTGRLARDQGKDNVGFRCAKDPE
jgi:formylglycine-generating enzyme required for sulfatase activity